MKNRIILLALIVALLMPAVSLFAAGEKEAKAADVYNVRFPSAEAEGDPMTVWAREFAAYMKEATDGKFNVEVFPYGTLGENDDIQELAQLGVVEFVFSDYGWASGFVPQANVLALHYIWPYENLADVLDWVVRNGESFKQIEKNFMDNDLIPLGIFFEGWQWITSRKPLRSPEDLRGVKLRVMGSEMLTRDYRAYNMAPTPMAYGEIYSALQTGLLDAQSQPMFANYSMGFYEVADHFVQLWAEPFLGIPQVNKQFFESLPADYQKLIKDWWVDKIKSSVAWVDANNEELRAKISAARPQITWYEFTDAQIAELRNIAETRVYPSFPEVGGPGSDKLLELLLADIEKAIAAVK
ncbi:MAG: TRAP transporter substrate-binding protein DctP [Sphaerochaetaceae bacterium]|jgi:TRAP-type C4-dicarboxylate transport system substrate-binding protein